MVWILHALVSNCDEAGLLDNQREITYYLALFPDKGGGGASSDTDGDGLSDFEEVGILSFVSEQSWIDLNPQDGFDITDLFANPDTSLVNYGLTKDMRVQGESVILKISGMYT